MKTIREIAEAVNVSKTSIYNLVKKHNIQTFKREGKSYIDENGESLITAYYSTEQYKTISDIITDAKAESESGTDETIQLDLQYANQGRIPHENANLISFLETELEKNHQIIQELLQTNRILSQALVTDKVNEAAQLMLKDNVHNTNDKEPGPNESKWFFKKFFNKK